MPKATISSRAKAASPAAPTTAIDPQQGQEGAAGDAAGQEGAHEARGFAVGVRLPGVQGCETHLGAVAHQGQHEPGPQPGPRQAGGVLHEPRELQRLIQPAHVGRVGDEQRAQQRQGDAHGADDQVLPGGLQGAAVVVEVDQGRRDQGGGLHGHPSHAGMAGLGQQRGQAQEAQEAGGEDPVVALGAQGQVGRGVEGADAEQDADDQQHPAAQGVEPEPGRGRQGPPAGQRHEQDAEVEDARGRQDPGAEGRARRRRRPGPRPAGERG